MSATAVIQGLGSQEFNAELYGSVSLTANLARAVTSRIQVVRISSSLRKTNRSLKTLFDLVDEILAGKHPLKAGQEPATPAQTQNVIDTLAYLSRITDNTYESMKRARLTNNSLTAGGLRTLHSYSDPLKDLVDWLDALTKSEEVQRIFDRAKEERDRGDFVDLSQVQ